MKQLKRVNNWQRQLRDSVHRHNTPFAYGNNDCARFVGETIFALTGTDVYAEFRGKYGDLKSSLKVMKAACGSADIEAIAEYIAGKYGMPSVEPHYAQRGDMVLLPVGADGALALGVVGHDNLNAHVVGESGMLRIPFVKIAKKAWRV